MTSVYSEEIIANGNLLHQRVLYCCSEIKYGILNPNVACFLVLCLICCITIVCSFIVYISCVIEE